MPERRRIVAQVVHLSAPEFQQEICVCDSKRGIENAVTQVITALQHFRCCVAVHFSLNGKGKRLGRTLSACEVRRLAQVHRALTEVLNE